MESIGASHEEECCEAGCEQEHAFYFVRVRTPAVAARWQQGAVDLKLDLHPRLRAVRPQALLRMTAMQLEVRELNVSPVVMFPCMSSSALLRSPQNAFAVPMWLAGDFRCWLFPVAQCVRVWCAGGVAAAAAPRRDQWR